MVNELSSAEILDVAHTLASRLQLFKKIGDQAKETESWINLDPREFWDTADQAALDRFEGLMERVTGAKSLFKKEDLVFGLDQT